MNTETGVLIFIGQTQKISDKFSKREFVIKVPGDYPQDILFQFVKDRCPTLDQFQIGQNVTVSFNLKGREWTNPQGEKKYFNTLEAWKIERLDSAPNNAPMNAHEPVKQPPLTSDEDDLTFQNHFLIAVLITKFNRNDKR